MSGKPPAHGVFLFEHLGRGRYLLYTDEVPGYVGGNLLEYLRYGVDNFIRATITQDDVTNADILLKRPAIVSGRVLDASGNPVAHARVSLLSGNSGFPRNSNWEPLPEALIQYSMSDQNGNFQAECLVNSDRILARATHPERGTGNSEKPFTEKWRCTFN